MSVVQSGDLFLDTYYFEIERSITPASNIHTLSNHFPTTNIMVDVCIIGAGLSGAYAANKLLASKSPYDTF